MLVRKRSTWPGPPLTSGTKVNSSVLSPAEGNLLFMPVFHNPQITWTEGHRATTSLQGATAKSAWCAHPPGQGPMQHRPGLAELSQAAAGKGQDSALLSLAASGLSTVEGRHTPSWHGHSENRAWPQNFPEAHNSIHREPSTAPLAPSLTQGHRAPLCRAGGNPESPGTALTPAQVRQANAVRHDQASKRSAPRPVLTGCR